LQVLHSPDAVPSTSNVLSTRFVRTWREKRNSKGETIWLRRSRFVAREFAWLEPERESLFSPASDSIIPRVLPTVFLERREKENMVMASLDVRDAFLTVKQECDTLVHTTDASGTVRSYSMLLFGKSVPWTARWKFALVSRNHQLPQIKSLTWRSTPRILPFFVQKMDLAW
jgi:hypothetical protein